ncbi:MAG TPA: hypothetical protein VIN08_16325 [Ohtaekwangia sp.]|uniref:hypothetical protein n=1 Tax=Ohtaekwangia sp. TaxID=2066019 RepID=UPI002F91CAF1
MKPKTTLLAAVLFVVVQAAVSVQSFGQEKSIYWVVETNAVNKQYSIVRFYDQSNQLMHEVKLDNIYIDIRKPKYQRKLNQLLKNYQERTMITSQKHKSKKSI